MNPHHQSRSATSTSISTAPPRGSAATPIAERVCRPASPNTSTSNRLAPSTTAGCCSKPCTTGDETEHGEDTFDPIEVAERGLQHGERVQRAPARGFRPLLDAEIEAERSRVDQRAVVVTRQLTRRARPATVHDDGVEGVMRRIGTGKRQPELSEPVPNTHSAAPSAHPSPPTRCCKYAGVSHAWGKWPRLVENTRPAPSVKHQASG